MELHGKRALLTGITGTVGSRLAHRLIQEGVQVRALVRRPEPVSEFEGMGVEWVQGDLADSAAVQAAMAGVQLVVHVAGYIGADEKLAERTNVLGTRNMVNAALAVRPELFVHISTISVYDLYNHTEFDEDSPLCPDPKNPYQATKTEAERAVWSAAAAGLPVLVIRPCNVLSARANSHWGPKMVQRVADGFNRWHPDGLFPWIHVENLADLTLLAMQTPAAVGQAFTAIDGEVPNAEYWGRIAAWVGNTAPPEGGSPARWHFHMEKNRSLGYRPRISFEEAMAELEAVVTGGVSTKAPTLNKLGGVFLHVKDLARATRFYSEIMGLAAEEPDPNSPIFCPPMEGPGLILDDNRNNIGTERDVRPVCILKSPDAGATLAFMKQKGVEICFEEHHEGKVFLFTFRDPEGNVLMVMQEH